MAWAVQHFRHCLYGHHCDIFTNHEALQFLLNTPHPSEKLARWGLALQEVDLSVFYHPGKRNFLANALFQEAKVSKQLSSLTEVHGKSLPARVRLGGWARSHKPAYPCCEKFLHSSISPIHQLIIHACFRLACQKKNGHLVVLQADLFGHLHKIVELYPPFVHLYG